jgi:putative phage-type endonuclease
MAQKRIKMPEIEQVGPGVLVLPSDAEREKWLKMRTLGIGGTDISAIIEVNPWRGAFDVWASKTGRGPELQESEAMRWGKILEDPIAKEWALRTGNSIVSCGLLRHQEHRVALANVDRLILDDADEPIAVLEVKTSRRSDDWFPGVWPGEGQLPPQYITQVLWYLGITGLPVATVTCLLGGQQLVQVTMKSDQELFEAMLEDAERFWHDHVEADVPPPPDRRHLDLIGKLYPDSEEDSIELPANVVEDLRSLVRLRDASKRLSDEAEDLQARIELILGDHLTGQVLGEKAVTWRTQTRHSLRVADLRKEQPELASKYDEESKCRPFLVNKKWAQTVLGTGDLDEPQ